MSTKRQDILAYFAAAVDGITGFGDTSTNRDEPFGAGTTYPAANVRSGSESPIEDESSLGMTEFEFEVEVDVVTEGDLEEMLGSVKSAVLADRTAGGKADHIRYGGADLDFKLSVPDGKKGMTARFFVRYEE